MIVSCPACSTRYLVEPSALGSDGRVVRCAKCEHSWYQTPPDDMPHQVDLAIPPAGSVPLPPRPRAGFGASRGAGLPLLILVLLALAVAGGYFLRERIVAQWPKTAQLYELIGLPTKAVGAGLEIANVKYTRQEVAGQVVFQIQGDIFNKTEKEIAVPPLDIPLQDASGKLLMDWTFSINQPSIRPGETISFNTEIKNAPAATAKFIVTFAGGS
ncbi:MAG TPA: DUF3426 domain-containing protein [Candidatus Polarisedimenticolia bacterium]|jgi:predicted Zn finger-like uncharacterized protein|nr:DUF3426 domain-containing protein [Candidatus Polarisedimenticolia bacterium]